MPKSQKFQLGSGHFKCRVPGRKETARGMKTAIAGIPGYESLGRPRSRYENLFNNSSKRPRGSKTPGQYFKSYENFQTKFEEFNFQDMHSYAYIIKYFC